jgi:hypothetical protein
MPSTRLRVIAGSIGLSLAVACAATRGGGSGALEPRFVAVHNAFAAMGLAQVGPIHEGSLAEGQEARVPLDLPAGCTTVVALGGDGVRDIDATLADARGRSIAHDTTSEPQAVLRACVDTGDTYALVVRAAAGSGPWVVATWAGGVGAPSGVAAAGSSGPRQPVGTCEAPIPLVAGTVSGSTARGESANAGSCDKSDAREIVYLLEVPQRQRVTIDVEARYDSVLYIRKDDCTDEGAEVECNDDAPNGGRTRSRIERVLEPGKYFVFVDGYNQEQGSYKLTVTTSDVLALTDACRRAAVLATGAPASASTAGFADDAQASCGGGAQGADAPWRFELPTRSRVRLVEHSDDLSPVVHVRRACRDEQSETACGEALPGTKDAAVTGVMDPGAYTVFADSRERDTSGAYTLSLETASTEGTGIAGDGCGDAAPLTAAAGSLVSGDTFAARDDVAGTCGGAGAADVIYRVDAPRRSRLRASLQSEEGPHVLGLSRRCGDPGQEIACGRALDEVVAPGTYFLAVDGWGPDALGRFVMSWSLQDLAAQASACASAPALVEHRSVSGTTVGSGDLFGVSCSGRDAAAGGSDRVFRLSVASRAQVRVTVTAPTFDVAVAVRKQCADDAASASAELACSAGMDRSRHVTVERVLERGTYWVVVDGLTAGDQGAFSIEYAVTAAR